MNRKYTFLLAGCVFLLCTSCLACQQTQPVAPTIEAVTFNYDNVNAYLLKNESLNLSAFYINISYSDFTSKSVTIDECTVSEITYNYGANEIDITYVLDDEKYYYSFDYYVFDNTAELEIIKAVHKLLYLNKLTIDDAETIIAIVDNYQLLTATEQTFLHTYYASEVDRLARSEKQLINVYHDTKVQELNDYLRTLNQSVYSSVNITAIKNLIANFTNTKFLSLKQIIEHYETTIDAIASIETESMSLDEYKEKTIEYLKSKFNIQFQVVESSSTSASIIPSEVQYIEENEKFGNTANEVISSIQNAADKNEVDRIFSNKFSELEQTILPILVEDFAASVRLVFENIRNIEKTLLDSWNDITISVSGLYDNILCDYLDDNRWWVPDVYRPKIILEQTTYELENSDNLDAIMKVYSDLVYEITRATLQKNLEMYYSIWRNYNPVYDTSDTLYWNIVADFWGDTPERQFVYNGPLSQYVGTIYGSSSASSYRLSSFFFKEGSKMPTAEALLDKYFSFKETIAPPPLAVSSVKVDLNTVNKEYNVGDLIDLTDGKAIVTYSDTSTAIVDLDNSMLVEDVDTSTIGSKVVKVAFKDPKLNQDCEASYSIVVLSNSAKYNNILSKISELPEITKVNDTHVALTKELIALFDELNELEFKAFVTDFEIEYNKFRAFETKVAPYYGKEELSPIHILYEKLNISSYSVTDREEIEEAYEILKTGVASHTELKAIDTDIENFEELLGSKDFDTTLSLDELKEATITSLDEICEYEVYKYSGETTNVVVNTITQTVKTSESVSAEYQGLVESIQSASDTNAVISLFNNNINNIYDEIIKAYKVDALTNVKQSMYDLRATISMVWAVGDNDIVEMKGEANGVFTTDYLDDGGYYCWYVPVAYQTGNLYQKIAINETANSKYEIKQSYELALYDMSRATMYRNIMHIWAFNNLRGNWWSVIFCSPALAYDGALPEYEGIVYGDSTYRLWGWGYKAGNKADDIPTLVEKYNYDLGVFHVA